MKNISLFISSRGSKGLYQLIFLSYSIFIILMIGSIYYKGNLGSLFLVIACLFFVISKRIQAMALKNLLLKQLNLKEYQLYFQKLPNYWFFRSLKPQKLLASINVNGLRGDKEAFEKDKEDFRDKRIAIRNKDRYLAYFELMSKSTDDKVALREKYQRLVPSGNYFSVIGIEDRVATAVFKIRHLQEPTDYFDHYVPKNRLDNIQTQHLRMLNEQNKGDIEKAKTFAQSIMNEPDELYMVREAKEFYEKTYKM